MAANALRLRRLTTAAGAWVMLPMDHGVSMGPIPGLVDVRAAAHWAAQGAVSCITAHRGLVPDIAQVLAAPALPRPGPGVLLHLSASTDAAPDPDAKRLVATVADAVRLGCDGVSLHVNIGSRTEADQVADFGRVASQCAELGMPLVAMAYPRGPGVKDPREPALVAHAARLAYELGADAVKVPYTGSTQSFADVVAGVPIPVLVAGGAKRPSFEAFVADVRGARAAGARGVSVGRNLFQAADPERAMAAVAQVFA